MLESLQEWVHRVVRWMRGSYSGLPFKPMRGVLSRLHAAYRRRGRSRVVTTRIGGLTWELDLGQLIDSVIYYRGSFEPDTARALRSLVRPGMVVADVGANIGAHAVPLAKLVGPAGRVHAFEPMAWARAKLERNLELNELDTVEVHPFALGAETRPGMEVELYCSWPTDGVPAEERHPIHGGLAMRQTTDLHTLDEVVAALGLERLDLVKIDVDGHELAVLRGATAALERFRPDIVMELGAYTLAEQGASPGEVVGLVEPLGYRFFREQDLRPFADSAELLAWIPDDEAVNVVLSCREADPATGRLATAAP